MITIPNWMFISSFEQFRIAVLAVAPISTLVHNGRGVWGSDFGSCSFVLSRTSIEGLVGRFLRLFDKPGSVASNEELEARFFSNHRFSSVNSEFSRIPGSQIAYWIGHNTARAFGKFPSLETHSEPRKGLVTARNEIYVRDWSEIAHTEIGFGHRTREDAQTSGRKWFPFLKGGPFRKWYGNFDHVVDWEDDGRRLRTTQHPTENRIWATNFNLEHIFAPTVTWSDVTSLSTFGARYCGPGFIISAVGCGIYSDELDLERLTALLCAKPVTAWLGVINPTVHANPGDLGVLPVCTVSDGPWPAHKKPELVATCIENATADWNAYERSWDFQASPLLSASSEPAFTLESSYTAWITQSRATVAEMRRLEEENNRLFIDAYGLENELTPDVPIEQITLTVNPAYRYGGKLSEDELWTRFREDSMQELVSYAIGCMLGRYSLDEPGLIYAHSGNQGFDPCRYTRFPADADGILPLTDKEWFADDAANRLIEFISVAWDKTHLEANLRFLADNLSPKKTESSRDTLRRYLCDNFFKDHLQTYKKRPIYWLFSSGKQKAFQCLVYLHRYNEGTLARMRTEYVIPLSAKLSSYAAKLEKDIEASNSTAEKKALEKQLSTLHNQQAELATFDEKLRHHADQRISLDLDDGVKVNYGKFGDLLAEVKAVTGDKAE